MTILSTAPIIDETGIRAPTYVEILEFFKTQFRAIYGQDIYIEPDSQDGQWLAVLAAAVNDSNAVAIRIYNSFSPASAQGGALSNNVMINGIARAAASRSSVDVLLVGQAGTTIARGVVEDTNKQKWDLPLQVVIPPAGQISVTAIAQVVGAIIAPAGTVTGIATPVRGWQSVTNPSDAVAGAPVESDASLRVRQAFSVALPSRTVLEGTVGAVASLPGVVRYRAYENDTPYVDADGLPPHSIALVVEGGDAQAIAGAIALKKTPGTGTYGNTTTVVDDVYGNPLAIQFFRPPTAAITAAVTIKALKGYTAAIGLSIREAIAAYVNEVGIGGGVSGSVEWADAVTAANRVPENWTFKISVLTLAGPNGAGTPDVEVAFNASPSMAVDDVALTVVV